MTNTAAPALAPADALQRLAPNSIKKPPVDRLYMASLWLVTGLCILVPVLYAGLIAAIGWLTLHYYTDVAPVLLENRGFGWLKVLALAIPGFVGVVLLLFLVKPFFAPRRRPPEEVQLTQGEEADFAAALRAMCLAVGIRPPARIGLSHQVNAWVQFDGGLSGFVLGRKRVTVGLPLVANLTARQLVGVLAHEFGHFAQGGAMRCSYLINTVNGWLYSRAYEHDAWDDRLERWTAENEGLLQLPAWIAAICLALTRKLLHLLFQLSFRMSRRLSQQMEFDADRYEAIIAGSSCFRETALRLRGVARAHAETDDANAKAWREGRLVDDMPGATEACVQRLKKEDWQRIAADLADDHDTHFWASHPADQARIANVEQLQSPGLFLDERPARELFKDYPALARRVTSHYYQAMGLQFTPRNLIDVQQLWKTNRLDEGLAQAWARYSNGMVGDTHLLSPEEANYKPASDFDWQGTVDELRRLGPDTAGLWSRLAKRRARGDELALWILLVDLDVDFTLPNGQYPDPGTLRAEYAACIADDTPDDKLAQRVLAIFARRLKFAVEAMPEAERAVANQRLALLQGMHGLWPKLRELEQRRNTLLRLFTGIAGHANQLQQQAYSRAELCRADWNRLLQAADALMVDELSLGKHLRNRCGHLSTGGDDPFHFLRSVAAVEDGFLHHYREVLADVGTQAETLETQRNIRPIKLVLRPVAAAV